jgi:hypothetical protein
LGVAAKDDVAPNRMAGVRIAAIARLSVEMVIKTRGKGWLGFV